MRFPYYDRFVNRLQFNYMISEIILYDFKICEIKLKIYQFFAIMLAVN